MKNDSKANRATRVVRTRLKITPTENDCVVVIYTNQPTLLGRRFLLEEGRVQVGRDAGNDILLHDESVSREHAHFERLLDGWYIKDDESTNGTLVNEKQIAGEKLLENGDRVQIGSTILRYLSGADAEVQYHEEIYRVSILDGLTQIYNKRYMLETLEREVNRARRHDRPMSLILFDIDRFKTCNDEYGHLTGDLILRELGKIVSTRIRREEVFARYGGEEFAIILPETEVDGAANLAENLLMKVEEHLFEVQDLEIRITISAGCAQLSPGDESANQLIERADQKLYEAKKSGRNRVCV